MPFHCSSKWPGVGGLKRRELSISTADWCSNCFNDQLPKLGDIRVRSWLKERLRDLHQMSELIAETENVDL